MSRITKLAFIVILVSVPALAQLDRGCWIAGDAANLASELSEGASQTKILNVLDYLRIGTERCRDSVAAADAWYYRGLIERYLAGQSKSADKAAATARAGRYLERATESGSLAAKNAWPLFGAKRTDEIATPVNAPLREKWAVVVGVGKFLNKGIPSLNYTSKDARDFANALTDPEIGRFKPGNVTVLLDEDATLVKVRTAIGAIRQKAEREDLVVLYISSHGSPRNTDPGGVSYVVLYDTDIAGSDTIYATGLAMSEIVATLNRDVKAQRLALFLDTCYSGAAAPGAERPGARALLPVGSTGAGSFSQALTQFNASGWVVVAASQGNEQSWESPELKQGYFTHFLLEELRNSKGRATMQELFNNLRTGVTTRVLRDKNTNQTPVMSTGADGGKLVLGV